MISHNIPKEDMIFIEPWTSLKNIIKINHQQVKYDHINNIPQYQNIEKKFIYIASYNGDGGLFPTDEQKKYRLGTTFSTINNISLPKNLLKLFSTNTNIIDERIVAIPYGVGNLYQHNVLKDILCYARFSVWTSPKVRKPISKWCERQPFINSEFSDSPSKQTEQTMYNFYFNLHRAKFSICPPGNGPDTYRVWESLYCNSIPIVIDSPLYRNFDLPILKVSNFYEITKKLLLETYETYCQN